MGSIAIAALLVVLAAPVQGKARPDLSVTGVQGVPATAVTGDELPLKVTVANGGNATSKAFKVTARLATETGTTTATPVIGAREAKPLAPGGSKTVKLKAVVPRWAPGTWRVVVCVPPGKRLDDCRASSPVEIEDGSASARIAAARAAGNLDPGEADLYGLYALTGDPRLPSIYRGNGEADGSATFRDIAADWPSLSQAEQDALWPYFLQPRYEQSAWGPPGAKRSGPDRNARAAAPAVCGSLNTIQGAWSGVESAHAVVWYRPGNAGRRAKAQALSGEFERKIWPQLTGAFQEVDDAAAADCDPAGDARVDIYLDSTLLSGLEDGVAPGVPLGPLCGPHPSFVILRENADRWTLAHEFMHVIQWAYPSCDRHPTWVEGTATWAGQFVYPGDQVEHRYPNGLFFSYHSLLSESAGDYHSWPFWYSVAKNGGTGAIKRFLQALAGGDRAAAFAALPGGLRATWKRYAVEAWNDKPIGSSGFPVREAFKQWDSFAQKPVTDRETRVLLGGLAERTFDLETIGPGGFANPGADLAPLSTSYTRVKIDDRRVRELQFQNALASSPGAVVQAFLKLENGRSRLEDWSSESTVTLCRDEEDENVTELIVATSNAVATGAPLGRQTHRLRARDECARVPVQGSFDGTESYTSDGGDVRMDYSFYGTVRFERDGLGNPYYEFGPAYPDEDWPRYVVTGVTITISGTGASFGCTVEIPSQALPLSGPGILLIEPGSEPRYGMRDVTTTVLPTAIYRCPPDNTPFNGTFVPPAGVVTPARRQTLERGTYVGSSTVNRPEVTGAYNWSLSEG